MAEGRVDDGMIEIGDPTEESPSPETAPQVVIQYHERGGVPWMLIPPLLVLSAVGAVLLYHKLAPRLRPAQPQALASAAENPGPTVEDLAPPIPPSSKRATELDPPAPGPAIVPEPPADNSPSPTPTIAAEPVKVPDPAPEPVTFPRVQGLGFDPKALEAERRAEAPADPALAPAARDEVPDDRDKPREVDPDLLPPDPRQARVRQQQRRLDALKKVDEERIRFHADMKAICGQKFRKDTAKKLDELTKRYETRVDPAAKMRAGGLLGQTGKFAGADRRTRVEVLRAVGYPEPVILSDLFEHFGSKTLGERDGPRTLDEALYETALFLIRNPPPREPSAARAVSNNPNAPVGRSNRSPAAFGEGAGPAR